MKERERILDEIVAIESEIKDIQNNYFDTTKEICALEDKLSELLHEKEERVNEVTRLKDKLMQLDFTNVELATYSEDDDGSVKELEEVLSYTPKLITYEEDTGTNE